MLNNAEVIDAAGASASRLLASGERWEYWSAEFRQLTQTVEEHLLFLNRECGFGDLKEAARAVVDRPHGLTALLRGRTRLRREIPKVKSLLKTDHVLRVSEFLYGIVQRALAPAEAIPSVTDLNFVDPRIHFPSEQQEEPALERLSRWLRGDSDVEQNVAVLLAPAAAGKTTLAEHIFEQFVAKPSKGLVPLLLKREQWASLVVRKTLALADVWTAGIAECYPRSLLGPAQLDTCLRSGTVRPVFDGLDELCTLYSSDFDPSETIAELVDVFEEGRVLVTSRTQYWAERVSEFAKSKVLEIELKPFSRTETESYLSKRFRSDGAKRTRARKILDRVAGRLPAAPMTKPESTDTPREERFIALPYVVMLAAEAADVVQGYNGARYEALLDEHDPLTGLLLAFCERERERQKLDIDGQTQLRILETLATDLDQSFDADLVEVAIGGVKPDYTAQMLGRFREHGLLQHELETFRFRYDFVAEHLAARALRMWIVGDGDVQRACGALRREADRLRVIVERAIELLADAPKPDEQALATRWDELFSRTVERASFLQFILAYIRHQRLPERADATSSLAAICKSSNNVLSWLPFRGAIYGFDFSSTTFLRCSFSDTEWSNCTFASGTRFRECTFDGRLSITSSTGFALATIDETCRLSAAATGVIHGAQGNAHSRLPYTREQIEDALRDILRFFTASGLRFNPMTRSKVERRAERYAFGQRMLRVLVKEGVLSRGTMAVSGNEERYQVLVAHEVKQFLDNATAVGHVRAALQALLDSLITLPQPAVATTE